MTTTHALAPWVTVDYLSRAELIKSADGKELAMRQDGASVADMRLMAAAPQLLLALEVLLGWHLGTSDDAEDAASYSAVRDAIAAIVKARGEQA